MSVRQRGFYLLLLIGLAISQGARAATFDETARLAVLAKVWGFLKYYHPEVAKGGIDWDEALLSVLEKANTAKTTEGFQQALNELVMKAGDFPLPDARPNSPRKADHDPLFFWMKDATHIPARIARKLEALIDNMAIAKNAFFSPQPAGNLGFGSEKDYGAPPYPEEGKRLLALFRYWNIIQYFFPYKNLIEIPWEDVLPEYIPKVRGAADAKEYHLAIRELTTRIRDGHGMMSSVILSEYWGRLFPPFLARQVEGRTIVTKTFPPQPEAAGGLRVGDVILSADGIPLPSLRFEKARLTPGSNEPSRQRNLNSMIFRGSTASLPLTILRAGQEINLTVGRFPAEELTFPDDTGPAWRLLDGNIGYIHMGLLKSDQVSKALGELKDTRAIVFDLRSYPEFILYVLAVRLYPERIPFVAFTKPDVTAPGLFIQIPAVSAGPVLPRPDSYRGNIVILVDETTQSRAEFTVMCLQAVPKAVTIGSQTAGADGNVSSIKLPGGIVTAFSGIGVYYPDGEETQKVGVRIDIVVHPTIAGIQAGRDEVLEKALEHIKQIGTTG